MSAPCSGIVGSPATFAMEGDFSSEDIHELLGAMGGGSVAHHHHGEEQVVSGEHDVTEEARRSERKRCREKQRRSDVNKQFNDLTTVLRKVDKDADTVGLVPNNRVDLIARTVVVLENLFKEREDRNQEIAKLEKELEEMKKIAEDTAARLKEATLYQQGPANPVMMMVPMMVNPADASMQGGGTASVAFSMAPSPFMQPQMVMPQAAAAAAAMAAPRNAPTQPNATSQVQMPFSMMMTPHPTMFALPTTTPSPPVPSPPQLPGQKQPAASNNNSIGGNLAHCA